MKDSYTFRKPNMLAIVCLRMDSSKVTRTAGALGEVGIVKSCREYTLPRDQYPSYPKSSDCTQYQNWTCCGKYLVTAQFGRHGIEMNIGSLAGVGSTSSVVISRGVERYVTEFSFGDTEAMNVDTSTLGTGQLAAFLPWQTQRNAASSNNKEKGELSSCLPITEKMAQVLRHSPKHSEEDEAVP